MSVKKQHFDATKATDKRHFRKPAKVRPASGKGKSITGGSKSITGGSKSLMEHFKGF